MLGGNNAVTRPACMRSIPRCQRVGVLTLDAHFDLRDTDCGLTNGNPIQALLEDGLPGAHIAQIGLLPFANTKKAHEKAKAAGISCRHRRACTARKAWRRSRRARWSGSRRACDVIHVDFDIDVVERSAMPGAPGARPGGVTAQDFFDATRLICAHPKVRSVDLTEFDPSLDVAGDLRADGGAVVVRGVGWFSRR